MKAYITTSEFWNNGAHYYAAARTHTGPVMVDGKTVSAIADSRSAAQTAIRGQLKQLGIEIVSKRDLSREIKQARIAAKLASK